MDNQLATYDGPVTIKPKPKKGRPAKLANTHSRDALLAQVLKSIGDEYKTARLNHKALNSPHEGYAVILEELDELWDEVKRNMGRSSFAKTEAKQTAAMCVAFIMELCQ